MAAFVRRPEPTPTVPPAAKRQVSTPSAGLASHPFAPMRMSTTIRCTLQALCVAALCMSLWLTGLKWTGEIDTVAGCGAGSGCAEVLGSRWSMVGGVVPVSLLAALTYLTATVALWRTGTSWRNLRLLVASVLVGAALWFLGLQVMAISRTCRYCLTLHAIGIATALGLVALDARHWRQQGVQMAKLFAAGLGATAWFAFIQIFGPLPATHRLETAGAAQAAAPAAKSAPNLSVGVHTAGTGRLIQFMNGRKSFRLGAVPFVGKPTAKHILVKYFDYTCDSCRRMHHQLAQLMRDHPADYAVIVLPTPLERSCNSRLPDSVRDHADACAIAKCALALWHDDPAAFVKFHDWVFETQPVLSQIEDRVGAAALDSQEIARWVESCLRQNIADYALLIRKTPVMPKLLVTGATVLQGVPRDVDALQRSLSGVLPP